MSRSEPRPDGSVLISNGHGRFHLVYAAQVAQEVGLLDKLITGAYPTLVVRRSISPLATSTGSAFLRHHA